MHNNANSNSNNKPIPCWLFKVIPESKKADLFRSINTEEAKKNYKKLKKYIFGNVKPDRRFWERDYIAALNDYNIYYDKDFFSLTEPIKIIQDLTRTFGKLRLDFGADSNVSEDDESLYCAMLRIIVYLDLVEYNFKYRQTMIDLFIPIYHIVWYGENTKGSPDIFYLEAVAIHFFKRFMENTNHINEIPGAIMKPNERVEKDKSLMEEMVDTFKKKDPKVFNIFKSCKIEPFFAMKWYYLVFTQDQKFEEVLKIWLHLCESKNIENFHKDLFSLCGDVVVRLHDRIIEQNKKSPNDLIGISTILQNITDLKIIGKK